MIDTHSHIYSSEFDDDRQQVIMEAQNIGIEKIVLANVDSSTISQLNSTQEQYPGFCISAMGLHPTSINSNYLTELKTIREQLFSKKYSAIGEIGIDLYWDTSFEHQQIEAFKIQLQWALDLDLPVIIHIRKAFAEVFDVLKKLGTNLPKGVFHCFSGGVQEALHAIKLGFMLGIGGVVTYKNTTLPEIIKKVGIGNIILETDAPYLAPVPYRGKRNEPKFMIETLTKIAEIFNLTKEKADEITTKSAKTLFRIE